MEHDTFLLRCLVIVAAIDGVAFTLLAGIVAVGIYFAVTLHSATDAVLVALGVFFLALLLWSMTRLWEVL